MKKVRPEPRPDKVKTPRPDPREPRVDPVPPEIIFIRDPIFVPLPSPPPPYEDYYYIESYGEPTSTNLEMASMILTSATLVWNGSYVHTGDSNAFVATAGFFTGVSSLAMAFSDGARYPVVDFLLGTAQIVFSIANLSNSLERSDTYEDEGYYSESYYSPPSTDVNLINYSYSF
jgi:hypothetical protein